MDKTIHQLEELTQAEQTDELIVYDVSAGKSKKIKVQNLVGSYSTDETFTGKYWIDGKPIFRKVFINTATFNSNSYNWGGLQSEVQAVVTGTPILSHMSYFLNNWVTREVRFSTGSGFQIDTSSALSFSAGSCYFTLEYTHSS